LDNYSNEPFVSPKTL